MVKISVVSHLIDFFQSTNQWIEIIFGQFQKNLLLFHIFCCESEIHK
jgi:hypothetical protein